MAPGIISCSALQSIHHDGFHIVIIELDACDVIAPRVEQRESSRQYDIRHPRAVVAEH